MNNRQLARRDLKTLRNDWWLPIQLTAPDPVTIYNKANGTEDQLLGDVRQESVSYDQETGEPITVKEIVITILIDDLERVPAVDEKWYVEFPGDFKPDGTLKKFSFTPNSADVGGDTQGWIKIRPENVE